MTESGSGFRFRVPRSECSGFLVPGSGFQFLRPADSNRVARIETFRPRRREMLAFSIGTPGALPLRMGRGARDHEELRAWQACNRLKLAIYALIRSTSIARDRKLREQLEDSAASAPANLGPRSE